MGVHLDGGQIRPPVALAAQQAGAHGQLVGVLINFSGVRSTKQPGRRTRLRSRTSGACQGRSCSGQPARGRPSAFPSRRGSRTARRLPAPAPPAAPAAGSPPGFGPARGPRGLCGLPATRGAMPPPPGSREAWQGWLGHLHRPRRFPLGVPWGRRSLPCRGGRSRKRLTDDVCLNTLVPEWPLRAVQDWGWLCDAA